MVALCRGVRSVFTSFPLPSVLGWDAETDVAGSNAIATENLCGLVHDVSIVKASTKDLLNADLPVRIADIVHIDADHSIKGIKQELRLAGTLHKHRGWILVDDTEVGYIADTVVDFAVSNDYSFQELPTLRGMMILRLN